MATFQTLRNSRMKTKASVKKSFSEDVFQSVKSLLQSEKKLCSISAEDCLKQDEHASLTEVTFLGFNEETDAAHIQDLAAVSLELPDLLNSLHFCSLSENEIICMKDINKSPDINSGPVNQSHHSGMLCVMRVSPPTLPRLRIDFIFSLLSKYATGIRYSLDTYLHQKHQLETTNEDDDDTNQSVSSIEDDFVTAFEHLEEEETSKPYNDGVNISALKSQCDAASQTTSGHQLETHDLRVLISTGQQKPLAKPSSSLINLLGHKQQPVKSSVTTSISEPWIQRSFYRSSTASDKVSDAQKMIFSSSPAYSSESECSSPSPVIFLDEEGYQKSLKAKLELPKIPVMKDDIEDSDSEKTVLAEKIVAEAIERAERELSSTSLAADSGIGQDGVSFAESLTTEIMTSAIMNVEHAVSSPKEKEDFQSTESFGSQHMNLSIGEDSTGSWSNLSFEDEHQDESSSFHHLSESDGPDDKEEEHEDDVEGLGQDGKTLLIMNIDMEPYTVDPQLRIILQWLVASEAEVSELSFCDSAKKEFIQLSKRLQEKGWKVGTLLQAVLVYCEVTEKTPSEECRSLFHWLLENA
uniref:A-kinase anchoring protein 11 n=1 Tax=Molossus molossus TaxID=27622 RepID=A0A7J8GJF3_MOLMO|nr:A-kinase anchoring protein 11 [Molossus molossus]